MLLKDLIKESTPAEQFQQQQQVNPNRLSKADVVNAQMEIKNLASELAELRSAVLQGNKHLAIAKVEKMQATVQHISPTILRVFARLLGE